MLTLGDYHLSAEINKAAEEEGGGVAVTEHLQRERTEEGGLWGGAWQGVID